MSPSLNPVLVLWCAGLAMISVGCGDAASDINLSDNALNGPADGQTASADAGGVVEAVPSDTEAEPSDITVVTEIEEDVDLSEWYEDAEGQEAGPSGDDAADVFGPEADTEGVNPTEDDNIADAEAEDPDGDTEIEEPFADVDDAVGEDISASEDVNGEPEEGDDDAGAGSDDDADEGGDDPVFADCEALGVAAQWQGTFEGEVETHIEENLAQTLNLLADALLPVSGELSFSISCVDSKLIVTGDMLGAASVVGQGDFPFELALFGYYNPETQTMDADIIQGMVLLYGLAEVYFVGSFDGNLVADLGDGGNVFTGQWEGVYDGTNFPLPAGSEDDVDASGSGTWSAAPSDEADTE